MTPEQARALFNEHREPGDLAGYGEKAAVAAIMEATSWQPIETAPKGECILYFPADGGRLKLAGMVRVDIYPVHYPRQPTHWMQLPDAPVPA